MNNEQQQMKEEEEEEEEFEYCNYGTETEPRFGEISYMVAGGGMMNGNAYATIELKDGLYYYCEYGNYPKRQSVGNEIVWSDEFYDKQNPYCSRNFNILDVEEEEEEEEDERYCDNDDCPYGGYIYDEELEKYKGKEYICIGCKTGKGLQERELEEEEEEKCEICDRNAYHKNDWHCSQGKEEKEEEE